MMRSIVESEWSFSVFGALRLLAFRFWEDVTIRAYKSKVATEWIDYVEKNHPTWSARIWQDGYDEHLLRIGEINRIRRYIRENPEKLYALMNWQKPF